MNIPDHGTDRETLFATLNAYRERDMPWRNGRVWGYVFDPGAEVEAIIKDAYTMFLSENALDPTVFPSALRLETEVVAMAASHLSGDREVVGNFTSGGTESIMLAVKTARDHARAERPHIHRPRMIVPTTAHAAFHKAGHYLDVEVVSTPVHDNTFKADVSAMAQAIDERTILLVGSAVSYAHGVVDPITDIAALAREHGLLCHIDACMGGFLLPYFRRLGRDIPEFDFRVPGVTSISMDLHKYAFAAKGASVILYRDAALRRHQIYSCAQWTGYTVVNATVQSSKSVGPIAAAWAVLRYLGHDGYVRLARTVLDATDRLLRGIRAIPSLSVLGEPDMNLIAFTCDSGSVFHIIDEMKALGWYIQPQLGYGGSRANIHLSVNPNNAPLVDEFLSDLARSTELARSLEPSPMVENLQRALAGADISDLSSERVSQLMELAGISGSTLPERMADINQLLDALPPAAQESLLTEFINRLFQTPPSP